MNANALAGAIATDRAAGREPCAIVATCGSTAATAFDPDCRDRADRARRGTLAARRCGHGGQRHDHHRNAVALWDGIEGADSLVVNPHKWLGVSMDCSTYFVRDAQFLVRVMSTNPSFLQTAVDGQVKNYRDWGIPLGRRMRALKLWFVIRDQGVIGLQARIRRDLAHAQWLAGEIGARATLEDSRARAPADAGGPARAAGPGPAAIDAHTRAGRRRSTNPVRDTSLPRS